MPGFDRTGPSGRGPMTGGGFGYCGAGARTGTGYRSGNRGDMGRRGGFGQRFGRGFMPGGRFRGFSRYDDVPFESESMDDPGSREAAELGEALAAIERRLARLEDEIVKNSDK
ncbi:MAG: DUF5320 family protein [Deltaproteobacteria bacterium]|nr:DUF5320 family protein [Deltaproteobacteria bacterium]